MTVLEVVRAFIGMNSKRDTEVKINLFGVIQLSLLILSMCVINHPLYAQFSAQFLENSEFSRIK